MIMTSFRCVSHKKELCNRCDDYQYGDDEQACDSTRNITIPEGICDERCSLIRSNIETFFVYSLMVSTSNQLSISLGILFKIRSNEQQELTSMQLCS